MTEGRILKLSTDRRTLLKRSAVIALGAPAVGSILAACDAGDDEGTAGDTDEQPEDGGEEEPEDEAEDDDAEADGETDDAAAEGERRGELFEAVLNNAGVGELDVINARHTKATVYSFLWADRLVNVDPETSEIADGLAESWEVNEDYTSFTFTLKEGVTFHNGEQFTADSVKRNFDDIAEAGVGSGYSALGGDNYVETNVVDELTVEVVFESPNPTFLGDSAVRLWFDSPTAKDEMGDDYGVRTAVGTGPFRVTEWIPDDHASFERFDDYNWGTSVRPNQGPAYMARMNIRGIPEEETRASTLEAGEADWVMLAHSDAQRFIDSEDFEVDLVQRAGTSRQLRFNVAKAPLDDINVRQAVCHAIDREAIVNSPYYSGIGAVAYMPMAPRNMAMTHEEGREAFRDSNYLFDPDAAVSLLEEAGWELPDGGDVREKDGERLSLHAIFPESSLDEIQPMQAMLADIGIHLELEAMQVGAWFDAREAGEFDVTPASNSGAGLGLLRSLYHTEGLSNDMNYSNEEIDELLDTLEQTGDSQDRLELAREVSQLIIQQAWFVPTIDRFHAFGRRPEVRDVFVPTFSWPDFYPVWIDE